MTLGDYIRSLSPEQKKQLAAGAETSVEHLYQLAGGHTSCGQGLAKRLVRAAREHALPSITLAEIRPDIWGEEAA